MTIQCDITLYLKLKHFASFKGRGDFFKLDKRKKQVTLLGPEKGEELPSTAATLDTPDISKGDIRDDVMLM